MFKNIASRSLGAMLLVSTLTLTGYSTTALAADDPSLHQIYEAANAGRLTDAEDMIQKVLRDHPNSAKAHFVNAELLAKQGRFSEAQAELATAERMAPGLPFAKPAAVQELNSILARSHGAAVRSQAYPGGQIINQAPVSSGMPWGVIILGVGALALIIFFVRRNTAGPAVYAGRGTGYGAMNSTPQPTYNPGYGNPGYGPQQGGGLGSSIVGGLATGAAVGAGIVAGEALMHHFTDGDRRERMSEDYVDNNNYVQQDLTRNDDMGGTDFGVTDSSSWDDAGGGGGGSDWDN